MKAPEVAIVDHDHGNLLSVLRACEHVGLDAAITAEPRAIREARAVILPGVGAFGEAMRVLRERELLSQLREVVDAGKPVIGICLGFQLLFTESEEFGRHRGLDLLPGRVVRLDSTGPLTAGDRRLKIPQIGWNEIDHEAASSQVGLLSGVPSGSEAYFLHSFYVQPSDLAVVVATTTYGGLRYCSVARRDNVMGCQFHPERSGAIGLRMYSNIAAMARS